MSEVRRETLGRADLARLDAALAREAVRLRARYQLSLDEFRGLYISDEQVDAVLRQQGAPAPAPGDLPPLSPGPALAAVIDLFGLGPDEADILVLALAPDFSPAYATLIAYLNDDVRRRFPTPDLVRRLFGAGPALDPANPLFGQGLLLPVDPAEPRTPRPCQEFAANPVLAGHLLGHALLYPPGLALEPPEAESDPGPLAPLVEAIAAGLTPLVAFTGQAPAARKAAARGLARRLGRPLLCLAEPAPTLLRDGLLAALLCGAILAIEADAKGLAALAPSLRAPTRPVILIPPEGSSWREALSGCAVLKIPFPLPERGARRLLWASALQRYGLLTEAAALGEVADRFRLSAAQIDCAAASIRQDRLLRPGERSACAAPALLDAARAQSAAELGGLARLATGSADFADIILPPGCLAQLRQLGQAIRHRETVFSTWGFGGGPGLSALFSGGPGTGKSMSAGVLARQAGLDLWRIDLSAVVSKYIGETEKQLERIFSQARDGNAILFFDEADALFGKRSEVRDAHDRYANIEVSFLLQRIEMFDGVVILATNLARNIDAAFSRRLQFIIEFPLPDAALRERLWRAALPEAAPLAPNIDYAFLARHFQFAGGDIRVAALDAAFAAAADDAPIDMRRLLRAVSRQLLKQGKVPQASDFREYRDLVSEPDDPVRRVGAVS
jgi:DNA polymerase III delta prime subunit